MARVPGGGPERREKPVRTRRRRRRRSGSPPAAGQPSTLADAVAGAVRDALSSLLGEGRAEGPIPLELALTLHPGEPWSVEAHPPLEEQIRRALREAVARRDVLQPGRVWCFRCESARCEHAVPPAPERVFGGYTATGLPAWPTLPEVLLARRHPEVGALFDSRSRSFAAAFIPGEELTGRQLEVFGRGSKTYGVLCQAVFGFLSLRAPGRECVEPDRAAFTLQAVETRTARGVPRLDLNVLGVLGDGSPAVEALDGPANLRILNIISVARRLLRHLTPPARGGCREASLPGRDLAPRAAAVLRDAVRALERLGRQSVRRTLHAETRGLERRPTANAREDALGAPAASLLRDERRGTVVVLGPNHRVHVFSPEGRHITSLLLDAEAVRRRRRRERWEPLAADARGAFRAALERAAGEEGYSPSPTSSST